MFLVCVLTGNAFFLNYNAFRCLNLFDMGSFLDASWRIFCGQKPYIDFIYYSGPVHLYMNAFFFQLFGFGKTAILAHLIVVHSAVIVLTFFMLYRRVPFYAVAAATLLTVPSFYWNVSHPWHDQSAHLWGIIGIFFIVRQIFPGKDDQLFSTAAICGVLGVISLITKTNLGAGYLILFFAVFVACANRKAAVGGYAAGLAIGILLALCIIRFPREYFYQAFLDNSVLVKGRLAAFKDPAAWFVNYYWVAMAIVAVNVSLNFRKILAQRTLLTLFFMMSLVGIYSVSTGGVIQYANNFLWGLQMTLALLVLYEMQASLEGKKGIKNIHRASVVLVLGITVLLTVVSVRDGIKLNAWTYVKWRPLANYTIQSQPLTGWQAYRRQAESLDHLTAYIKVNVPKEQSLLNLTDMYLIYALTGRDSYRGIPWVFLEGAVPSPGRQTEQVRQAIKAHPPDWIITSIDSAFVELKILGLQRYVFSGYEPVLQSGIYVLLKKK